MKILRLFAILMAMVVLAVGCMSGRKSSLAKDKPGASSKGAPVDSSKAVDKAGRTNAVAIPVERLGVIYKARDIIGREVRGESGAIGEVKDLIVDVEAGRISLVILSLGGVMGFGDTVVAVPPGIFKSERSNRALFLETEKAKVLTAPKFNLSEWRDFSTTNRTLEVYSYFDKRPYFVAAVEGTNITGKVKTTNTVQSVEDPDKPAIRKGRASDLIGRSSENDLTMRRDRNRAGTGKVAVKTSADKNTTTNKLGTAKLVAGDKQDKAKAEVAVTVTNEIVIGDYARASKLIGLSVRSRQDEKLGKVDDLMVDLHAGRIVHVLVASGGFLRFGGELSAAPSSAFDYEPTRDLLRLDTTREALVKASHFKRNKWPNYNDPDYVSSVYKAYEQEPYFRVEITDTNSSVKLETPDPQPGSVKAIDQSLSTTDVETTRRIRKDIMDRKGLSLRAHNITIVTQNGRVTLTGSVVSPEEKRTLEEIATKTVRRENVVSELEVRNAGTVD